MCDLKKKYNSIMILMPREKYCYRFGGFPFTPYIYSKDCFMQLQSGYVESGKSFLF